MPGQPLPSWGGGELLPTGSGDWPTVALAAISLIHELTTGERNASVQLMAALRAEAAKVAPDA